MHSETLCHFIEKCQHQCSPNANEIVNGDAASWGQMYYNAVRAVSRSRLGLFELCAAGCTGERCGLHRRAFWRLVRLKKE
jgi:hypothetical protein